MASASKCIVCFLLILFAFGAKGQDTVYLLQRTNWDSVYEMENYARYYVEENGVEDVRNLEAKTFIQDSDFYHTLRSTYKGRRKNAWIRWIIHNPLDHEEEVALYFHRISFFSAWYADDHGARFLKDNYAFITTLPKDERRSVRFAIAPRATVKIYVRMKNAYQNFGKRYPVIIRPAEYTTIMNEIQAAHRYFTYVDVLFLSIIFFITLHTLAQYFFNRRKEFLLYAFYAMCVFNYFLLKFDEAFYVDLFFSYLPYVAKIGNNPFSYLMFYAYYRFARSFIDFKAIAPWFLRVILVTEKLLLAAVVLDILFAQLNMYPARSMMFNIIRSYLIVMAFTGIYILFRNGKPLPRFIAVGSGCFVLGALIAMVLSWLLEGPYINRFDPIIYMQLGMVVELLCFTLGLSYKTSLIEKETIATQQQLIGQLEQNKRLQEELNTQLETRVKEQTSHILDQQQQIEKEKEQQLTLEFTKKLTEMELQLLKSQLNPHFYFNTLHNLYGLSMIAPKKAPDAILKLSDIMEYVIYDCRNDKVPLVKELRFINSYIELEKLRYDDHANIRFDVTGDPDGQQISPLLLIQFVENAFKHGLEHFNHQSHLSIAIDIQGRKLRYASVNSVSATQASSTGGVGLANVKKRLEIIYPSRHELRIHSNESEYTVELILDLS